MKSNLFNHNLWNNPVEYNEMSFPDDETYEEECELCGFTGSHDPDCVMHKNNLEADIEELENT